jgi:hypothetical protein
MMAKLCPLVLLSLSCLGGTCSAEAINPPKLAAEKKSQQQQEKQLSRQLLRKSGLLLHKHELPSDREWVTLDDTGVEFQPGPNNMDNPQLERAQRNLGRTNEFQTSTFEDAIVNGAETYYDEYAQAWRVLGFYIDCDACTGDDYGYGNCYAYRGDNYTTNDSGCQRYLLWAAVSTKTMTIRCAVSLESLNISFFSVSFVFLTRSVYRLGLPRRWSLGIPILR